MCAACQTQKSSQDEGASPRRTLDSWQITSKIPWQTVSIYTLLQDGGIVDILYSLAQLLSESVSHQKHPLSYGKANFEIKTFDRAKLTYMQKYLTSAVLLSLFLFNQITNEITASQTRQSIQEKSSEAQSNQTQVQVPQKVKITCWSQVKVPQEVKVTRREKVTHEAFKVASRQKIKVTSRAS